MVKKHKLRNKYTLKKIKNTLRKKKKVNNTKKRKKKNLVKRKTLKKQIASGFEDISQKDYEKNIKECIKQKAIQYDITGDIDKLTVTKEGYNFLNFEGLDPDFINCYLDIFENKTDNDLLVMRAQNQKHPEEQLLKAYNDLQEEKSEDEEYNKTLIDSHASVFKFHIQPKKDRVADYLGKLIDLYMTDETFKDNIMEIKILENISSADKSPSMPILVIYPKCDEDQWKIVLESLKKLLSSEDNQGNNLVTEEKIAFTPRYNIPIQGTNGLLFIANGDSDFKKSLIKACIEDNEKYDVFFSNPEIIKRLSEEEKERYRYSFFKKNEQIFVDIFNGKY